MTSPPDPHDRHQFPAEIISHVVWLYHVFSLSLRDVELILAERGVVVSYETVRRWCRKFATSFADRLRRRRPRPGERYSSASRVCSTTYGVLSISMALCSTSWFRRAATPRQRSASSSDC